MYEKIHTVGSKIKMSKSHKGKKHSEETKKKMSESHSHKGIFKSNKHPLYGKRGKDNPNFGSHHKNRNRNFKK